MAIKRITFKRRTFVGAGVAGAGLAFSLPRCKGNGAWRFFTEDEAQTVDAICEQLIPEDGDPGARKARVLDYIDIQLMRSFKRYQRAYRQGIAAVDENSRAKFGKRFVELSAGQQVEILTGIEEHSKPFFNMILDHCRQGFYGDPRHGGNREMASWKMLGLPYPPVRGRMHYDG